jgi:hypothetical protein
MGSLPAPGPQAIGASAQEGVVRKNFPKQIPRSLRFADVQVGMDAQRNEIKWPADHGQYASNANGIVRFTIPNDAVLDFRHAFFRFDATISVTGGTYVRASQGIWSLFDRLRVKFTTAGEVEDVRELNLAQSMFYEIRTEADVSGSVGPVWGVGTPAERNAWAAGRDYAMPIFSGFLASGVIPLKFIKDHMQIEFYVAKPSTCIETDGTDPVITIDNPQLIYDKLHVDVAYEAALSSKIASSGLSIGFKTIEHYQNAISSAKTSSQINHRADSVDYLVHVLRTAADTNDLTVDDKFITYNKNLVTQYQAKINGEFHPEEPVVTTGNAVQSYCNMLKFQRKWVVQGLREDAPTISVSAYNNDRFIMVNDVRAHTEEDLVNPRGTAKHSADMQFDLLASAAPASPLHLETFVKYATVVVINKSGKIVRVF